MTANAKDVTSDRRVRRTRAAILAAFNRLILDRGYGALTPGEVATAADVGRSTFYLHFRGIDDVLATTLGPMLAPLATNCFEERPSDEARGVVEHIWENRGLARVLLSGEAQAVVLRTFAAAVEEALRRVPKAEARKPILAPDLIALQLAAAQLALLGAWIMGRTGHSAHEIAIALHAGGRGSALALMG